MAAGSRYEKYKNKIRLCNVRISVFAGDRLGYETNGRKGKHWNQMEND